MAYIANENGVVSLYVNGNIVKSGDFDIYSPLLFDDSDKNIMYYGFRGDDLWFEVQPI